MWNGTGHTLTGNQQVNNHQIFSPTTHITSPSPPPSQFRPYLNKPPSPPYLEDLSRFSSLGGMEHDPFSSIYEHATFGKDFKNSSPLFLSLPNSRLSLYLPKTPRTPKHTLEDLPHFQVLAQDQSKERCPNILVINLLLM